MDKKRMIRLLAIYISIMLVIIFFSKTIYNYSLPSVTVSETSKGCLNKTLEGYGELTFQKTYDIFSGISGQITEIYCDENGKVSPQGNIAKIEYISDKADISKAEASLAKLHMSIEQMELEKNLIRQKIENIKNKEAIDMTVTDLEISSLENDIVRQEETVETQYALYQAGAISMHEYENELTLLDNLKSRLEIKNAERNATVKSDKEQKNEDIKGKESKIAELDNRINETMLDLSLMEAELALMKAGDMQIVTNSCYDGIVINMHVQQGEYISKGSKIATIGAVNESFTLNLSEPKEKAAFIEIGDMAEFVVGGITAEAVVSSIKPDGGNIKITFMISSDDFTGGEYGKISVSKTTSEYDILVPNEAVVREEYSSYIWVMKSRYGSLGQEYYAVKSKVFIADYDGDYTAIAKGLYHGENVIVNPSSELENNKRVLPY